ncbi:MAG: glycoside hydrolase family 1 [Verrucomicrobia bacterium]|nr:MAG: glycoside hydrolase family 1 [Verrucomicrobiota bacterium]
MSLIPRFFSAAWISKNQVLVLLSSDWLDGQALPPINFYVDSELVKDKIEPAPLITFGKLTGYYINNNEITFIYRPQKNEKEEKIYVAGNFNGWGKVINDEKWLMKPRLDKSGNDEILELTLDWAEIEKLGEDLFFKFVTQHNEWLVIPPETPNATFDEHNNNNYAIYPQITGHNAFILTCDVGYDPEVKYAVSWEEGDGKPRYDIDDKILLCSLASTQELGCIIAGESTLFRLFAPSAQFVKVFFYSEQNPKEISELSLKRNSDFTWEGVFSKNLHGYRYYYNVSNDTPILDPYALACYGPSGPGIVIDKSQVGKIKSHFEPPRWEDLIILETHLRDLIEDTRFVDKMEKPAGFRDFIEWLKSDDNYIEELGINALEFLPIQEFETHNPFEYHWGYMPTNYFCPSSSYAFGENEMSHISDFRELVAVLHEKRIAVILDVVYNHSGSPKHLLNIDKNYYFLVDKNGNLTNWSGCGNDFNASTPMGKRLILESLIYLIETFDVDGFRFDLAELLGIPVLEEIFKALKQVKPSIILIAEPWSFRGHIGHALKDTGFSSWNDGYREFIGDYVRGLSNHEAFVYFVTGSISYLARFPSQSVNYAASHDDYCWIDKITENPHHDGSNPTVNDIRRTHLMVAILMMSVGIPMIAEGQDFLHSKGGYFNSYNNEYVNTLRYINLCKHSHTHEYFSEWIRFRLSEKGKSIRLSGIPSDGYFRFYKSNESSMSGILFNADSSLDKDDQLLFIVNPHILQNKILVSDLKREDFVQIGDQDRLEPQGLQGAFLPWNENQIILPGLSFGLWIKK